MKYLIIGAGGTGGCIGAYLAHSRQDVTFIARGKHLENMVQNGLTIHSKKHGQLTIFPVKASTMDAYNDTPDVIFVCTKYYALSEVIPFINRVATPQTLVIPVLNVLGTGEILQKDCPNCTILDGCIYIVGFIESPGIISQPADIFKVYFGYRNNQEHSLEEVAVKVAEDLNKAHIEGYFTKHILKEALQKFSFVSPMGAAGLYHQSTAGAFMQPSEKQDTFIKLVKEVEQLGHAMGITFDHDLTEVNLQILYTLEPDATTSMQRDVLRGGASEIDGLVHHVLRLANAYHISLPTYNKISQWALAHQLH